MKSHPIALALLAGILPVVGQEPAPAWNVEIPPPIVVEVPAQAAEEPEPIEFEVLSSRTKEVFVSKAAEMPDLPPIEGTIKMTVQRVANPGLTDPPPPLPSLPPDDPAVIARLQELRETYRGTDLVFLSASVHMENRDAQEARTLLRIYPNGQVGKVVVAWSNVNFLHLTGQGGYRVNYGDGTQQDVGILMGIRPWYTETVRRMAERAAQAGREYHEPEIPELPDLATAGPDFLVIEGDDDSPAMDVLEQLHDLFEGSGKKLKDQYVARELARAERKAFLLANPPKPKDVTVRVWRRTPTRNAKEESR
jgi:hypothetical protein